MNIPPITELYLKGRILWYINYISIKLPKKKNVGIRKTGNQWVCGKWELSGKRRIIGLKEYSSISGKRANQVRVNRPRGGVSGQSFSHQAGRGPSASGGQVGHLQD